MTGITVKINNSDTTLVVDSSQGAFIGFEAGDTIRIENDGSDKGNLFYEFDIVTVDSSTTITLDRNYSNAQDCRFCKVHKVFFGTTLDSKFAVGGSSWNISKVQLSFNTTSAFAGTTATGISAYLHTRRGSRVYSPGLMTISLPGSGNTAKLQPNLSGHDLTSALYSSLHVEAAVSRALSNGGYKWRVLVSKPLGDLRQFRVSVENATASLVSANTLQNGALRLMGTRSSVVDLPITHSTCGKISGTLVQAVNKTMGIATFDDLKIDAAGSSYTLRYEAISPQGETLPVGDTLLSASSATFTVRDTSAKSIRIVHQPRLGLTNKDFSSEITFDLRDRAEGRGSIATGHDAENVTLAINMNHGDGGGGTLFSDANFMSVDTTFDALQGFDHVNASTASSNYISSVARGDILELGSKYYQVMPPGKAFTKDVQQVTFSGVTSGTFSLTAFDVVTTGEIYANATGDAVKSALEAVGVVGLESVARLGTIGGYRITFVMSAGDVKPLKLNTRNLVGSGSMSASLSVVSDGTGVLLPREVQIIHLATNVSAIMGSFRVMHESTSSGDISVNAAATSAERTKEYDCTTDASVQGRLQAITALGGTVAVTKIKISNSYSWRVSFSSYKGNSPTLTIDATNSFWCRKQAFEVSVVVVTTSPTLTLAAGASLSASAETHFKVTSNGPSYQAIEINDRVYFVDHSGISAGTSTLTLTSPFEGDSGTYPAYICSAEVYRTTTTPSQYLRVGTEREGSLSIPIDRPYEGPTANSISGRRNLVSSAVVQRPVSGVVRFEGLHLFAAQHSTFYPVYSFTVSTADGVLAYTEPIVFLKSTPSTMLLGSGVSTTANVVSLRIEAR